MTACVERLIRQTIICRSKLHVSFLFILIKLSNFFMNQFTLIVIFYATYTTHVLHKVVLGLFEIILCEQLNLLHVYMTQVNT